MSRGLARQARILIHLDERRRDFPVLAALKILLERAGHRVILSTRRHTLLYLRRVAFDAIIVPYMEHIPYGDIPAISARSKIYMLPTEGILFNEGPLLLKYAGGENPKLWDRQIRAVKRFFLWGNYSRRILLNTGKFREDQLAAVGGPRMDFFLAGPTAEEKALSDPRALGGITGFSLTNSFRPMDPFQRVDAGRVVRGLYESPTRQVEDRLWIETAWVRVWLQFFDECRERGERIRLRVHHRENLQSYGYLRRKYASVLSFDGQDLPFESWLDRLGILLGYNSTTFFEAVALGKPAISMEGLIGPRLQDHTDSFVMNHYPIMDHLETPGSFDELFDFIARVRRGEWEAATAYGPEAQAILRDVCHYPRSNSALAEIVETIQRDLGTQPVGRAEGNFLPEWLARAAARSLDLATFQVRRDAITGSWFPLHEAELKRRYVLEIARYLRAAAADHAPEHTPPAAIGHPA